MFKFIHAADIHLDSPLKGLERYEGAPAEQIRTATRRAFENLVQLALAERVAFVLIAGDLYDGTWPDYNTGLFFLSQLAMLREASIDVVLLAGNHDAENKMTRSLDLRDKAVMLSVKAPQLLPLERHGVVIHGQGFAERAVKADLSSAYPQAVAGCFNIGMLHTSAAGYAEHDVYAPCRPDALAAKGYDYWALGHIHKQQPLDSEKSIWFSGNLQGRHIRETGAKGCLLVTVEEGRPLRVEPQACDVFRWEECPVDAAGAADGDEVLARLAKQLQSLHGRLEGRMAAVRVTVRGACRAHAELASQPARWTNEIRSCACDAGAGDYWVEKVKLDTSPPGEPSVEDGPVGELLRLIETVRSDDTRLAGLACELKDLKTKLPPDLLEGPDRLDFESPEALRRILGDVRWLLADALGATRAEGAAA